MDRLAQPPLVSSEISAQVQFHIDLLLLCPPRPRFEGSNLSHSLPLHLLLWITGCLKVFQEINRFRPYLEPFKGLIIRLRLRRGHLRESSDASQWPPSSGTWELVWHHPSLTHHYNQILPDTCNSSICVSLLWLQKWSLRINRFTFDKRNIGIFWCLSYKHFWVIRVI